MTDYVLLSSGFIIPKNRWFSPVEKENTYLTQLLNRVPNTVNDSHLTSLINLNAIYSSKECNEIYLNYQHKPSFENYMRMIDILSEIFSEIDIGKFFEIQSKNIYLSPLGFGFINDTMTSAFIQNYKQYAMVPSFFRTVKDTNFSDMEARKKVLNETRKTSYLFHGHRNVTLTFLTDLSQNRDVFATFFRYMLTDSNRGNSYA